MRIGFDKANFDQLAALWNDVYPEKFAVDAEILRRNTVDSHLFDWGSSIIEVDNGVPIAFLAVKKSAAPLFRGPDPDQAHITALAFRNPLCAVDLMSYAKKLLLNRGVYKLIFGQDTRHFFPGCPEEMSSLRDFLMVEGFEEGSEQVDLEADLAQYDPPSDVLMPLSSYPGLEAESGPSVKPISDEHRDLLREFLEREFPGRWRYDTFAKISEEERSDFVYGLFIDGRIEGFAITQDWTHRLPIAGCVWRKNLGDQWGGLGPIGVSKSLRGQGYGDALLAASLLGLKQRGVRRCIIDWTNLVDFYGKHGFDVSRRYKTFTLQLTQN